MPLARCIVLASRSALEAVPSSTAAAHTAHTAAHPTTHLWHATTKEVGVLQKGTVQIRAASVSCVVAQYARSRKCSRSRASLTKWPIPGFIPPPLPPPRPPYPPLPGGPPRPYPPPPIGIPPKPIGPPPGPPGNIDGRPCMPIGPPIIIGFIPPGPPIPPIIGGMPPGPPGPPIRIGAPAMGAPPMLPPALPPRPPPPSRPPRMPPRPPPRSALGGGSVRTRTKAVSQSLAFRDVDRHCAPFGRVRNGLPFADVVRVTSAFLKLKSLEGSTGQTRSVSTPCSPLGASNCHALFFEPLLQSFRLFFCVHLDVCDTELQAGSNASHSSDWLASILSQKG